MSKSIKKDMNNTKDRLIARGFLANLSTSYPLEKPIIQTDYDSISAMHRVAETMRYNLLCLEYFLAPRGGLRQFIKIILSLTIIISLPLFVLTNFILPQFTEASSYFMKITENISISMNNLLWSVIYAFATALSIYAGLKIFKWLL